MNSLTARVLVGFLISTAVAGTSASAQSESIGGKRLQIFQAGKGELGSGTAKEEIRKLPKFNSIILAASGNIDVSSGKKGHSVTIVTDDNLMPLIKTTVENEVLTITTEKPIRTKAGLKFKVDAKDLQSVNLKGSGNVHVDSLAGKSFQATIGGAGEIEALGTVDEVTANIKGSGNIRFNRLQAKTASADISGAGNISLFANKSLAARISGAGNVDCFGSPPEVKKDITGGGDVVMK